MIEAIPTIFQQSTQMNLYNNAIHRLEWNSNLIWRIYADIPPT